MNPDPELVGHEDDDPNTNSDASNHRYDEEGNMEPPEEE